MRVKINTSVNQTKQFYTETGRDWDLWLFPPTWVVNPDWNEEEEVEDVIVLDDDIDIEED